MLQTIEGEGSDEEPDKPFINCKPLAPAEHVRQAHQPATPPEVGRVFFGNDPFYHFFRLHQHLYDRCRPLPLPHPVSQRQL